MGTLTITASGFANLAAGTPANWPTSSVTYPASGNPNGTKAYTISDADWARIVTWVAAGQLTVLETILGSTVLPLTPTAAQILLAYVQVWVNGTIASERQFSTTPAVPPTPVVIT